MISTICMNRAPPTERKEASTLIIAPVALLDQWQSEVEKKSKGSLRCLIYHGQNKTNSKNVGLQLPSLCCTRLTSCSCRQDLRKYDVVLTTASTLGLQWTPDGMPNSIFMYSAPDVLTLKLFIRRTRPCSSKEAVASQEQGCSLDRG